MTENDEIHENDEKQQKRENPIFAMWHEKLLSVDTKVEIDLKVVIFGDFHGHFWHFRGGFCLDFGVFNSQF